MVHVDIYTDGSSRGNPGPGGFGTVVRYVDADSNICEEQFSCGFKNTTNNRMEVLAAIVGLESLKNTCDVTLYSDSQYLVKAHNDNWIEQWITRGWKNSSGKPVKNVDLWMRLLKAEQPHNIKYIWVKGHDGNKYNELCDLLATQASDGPNLQIDSGFENWAD